MIRYQFSVETDKGGAVYKKRDTWEEAAQDAVTEGWGEWRGVEFVLKWPAKIVAHHE